MTRMRERRRCTILNLADAGLEVIETQVGHLVADIVPIHDACVVCVPETQRRPESTQEGSTAEQGDVSPGAGGAMQCGQ